MFYLRLNGPNPSGSFALIADKIKKKKKKKVFFLTSSKSYRKIRAKSQSFFNQTKHLLASINVQDILRTQRDTVLSSSTSEDFLNPLKIELSEVTLLDDQLGQVRVHVIVGPKSKSDTKTTSVQKKHTK